MRNRIAAVQDGHAEAAAKGRRHIIGMPFHFVCQVKHGLSVHAVSRKHIPENNTADQSGRAAAQTACHGNAVNKMQYTAFR